MPSSRLTRFGLVIAFLGWALLLFGGMLPQLLERLPIHDLPVRLNLPTGLDIPRNDIAQMLIVTGFALSILGALRACVDALQRFFEAVLQRAAAANAQPAPPMPEAAYVDPDKVVERGRIVDRPYARFADGSVEVETLLGVRRFPSFAEAEEFIGR